MKEKTGKIDNTVKIKIPQAAAGIIDTLYNAGFEAYVVGGCVRDSVMGRVPHDWDITTSAKPHEVKKLFRRTIDTGIQHGTVTVMIKGEGYEVTTYRIDGDYSDHRRPDRVDFADDLSEDLRRRDFTVNAMAYNDRVGLVDLFGGLSDIENKVIRCVGDPDERFNEDALRILRAVRFSAQLGFDIEEKTREAVKAHVDELPFVSAERIEAEFTKLITSPHPEKLEDAFNLGITKVFIPEFDAMMETEQRTPYHKYDVGHHTIEVMKHVRPVKYMRYAALLHDAGKPVCKTTEEKAPERQVTYNGVTYATVDHFKGHAEAGAKMAPDILKRLKMDNDTIDRVRRLVYFHDAGISREITKEFVRKLMSKLGAEHLDDLLEIKNADIEGQSDYSRDDSLKKVSLIKKYSEEILRDNEALTIKDLAINGNDLMKMGYPKGPIMGEILRFLLDKVLEEPELNQKETLIKIVKEVYDIGLQKDL